MVMAFIDVHREELGIEPICRELAIAPSSYHEHAARLADAGKRPARARRDDEIKEQISRVHEASFGLYGTRRDQDRVDRLFIAFERRKIWVGMIGLEPDQGLTKPSGTGEAVESTQRSNGVEPVSEKRTEW